MDEEVSDHFAHYQYAKIFGRCTKEEFESLPYKETQWLLQMDAAYNAAVNDANEKAVRDQEAQARLGR